MNYILKQYDNDLLYFSKKNTNDGLEVLINTVNQKFTISFTIRLRIKQWRIKKMASKKDDS